MLALYIKAQILTSPSLGIYIINNIINNNIINNNSYLYTKR